MRPLLLLPLLCPPSVGFQPSTPVRKGDASLQTTKLHFATPEGADMGLSRGGHLSGIFAALMAGASCLSLPLSARAVTDVGIWKKYIDSQELFTLQYPLGWFLSRRETQPTPAFVEKPSATLLLVADYSSGATVSVTRTKLPILVRDAMGLEGAMPANLMRSFGRVRKFADILDGNGVAKLLVRDRDGELKSSMMADEEGEDDNYPGKQSRYLSTVHKCDVMGPVMEFEVTTPVSRVATAPLRTGGRRLRSADDVLAGIQDASPVESGGSGGYPAGGSRARPPKLIRQKMVARRSKAKSYLKEDGTVLTAWVSADQALWDDEAQAANLNRIVQSFDVAPR